MARPPERAMAASTKGQPGRATASPPAGDPVGDRARGARHLGRGQHHAVDGGGARSRLHRLVALGLGPSAWTARAASRRSWRGRARAPGSDAWKRSIAGGHALGEDRLDHVRAALPPSPSTSSRGSVKRISTQSAPSPRNSAGGLPTPRRTRAKSPPPRPRTTERTPVVPPVAAADLAADRRRRAGRARRAPPAPAPGRRGANRRRGRPRRPSRSCRSAARAARRGPTGRGPR